MPYIHLVVNPHDTNYPYENLCKGLFQEGKCLAILEDKPHPHVHIQGYCDDETYDALGPKGSRKRKEYTAQLNKLHEKRKRIPTSNPVKIRGEDADDVGFQYMCKDYKSENIVFKQGFEDEELEELKEKSDEYRDELKTKLGEFLVSTVLRKSGECPRQLHFRLCCAANKYYMDQDKMAPPNIKLLVRHFMLKYYGNFQDVFEYLSELIM